MPSKEREREKKEGGRGALHVSAVTVAPVARWRGEKKEEGGKEMIK